MLYDLGPRARRVYTVLLDRVRSGELAPGTRLPPHTELAQSFGVAPLTIRQVLAQLEVEGLLARERGRGTFVRATQRPRVLIVAWSPMQRAALLEQVRDVGQQAIVAATSAEGLAALKREPSVVVLLVDLRLPTAREGLNFVRAVRRQRPRLQIAVFEPTSRQKSRLEHTVAPPLFSLGQPATGPLAQFLHSLLSQPVDSARSAATDAGMAQRLADLLERFVALQLAGERGAARQLVLDGGLAAGVPLADVYVGVLQPAQYRIGELWQRNQINAAREHLATAISASVMAELVAATPHALGSGSCVLVACVEGELHDLGARMVADLLEVDGIGVRFLGANVPTDSLLSIVEEEQPLLVVLSMTMPERLMQLRQAVAGIRRVHGPRLPVFVGGQALAWVPDLGRLVDADLAARDARETLHAARRFLAGTSAAALDPADG
jgi:MerR family transcriptional regulator, light-induced transcriptional regulator